MDFVYTFEINLSVCSEFLKLFPDAKDHLDLPKISKLCGQGRYEAGRGVGILTLFDDLQRMVNNSKAFNHCNKDFQPWRLADMLDKELLVLRELLAGNHNMPALLEQVATARELEEERGEEEVGEI